MRMAGSSLQTMIRDLHRRRGRERRELVLLEGVRLVEEALAAEVPLRGALVSPALETTPRGAALKAALRDASPKLEEVTERELAELAATEHPQGVVVVADPPAWTLEQIAVTPVTTVLVLEGVQDPGNVGTIVRTAFGLGAAGVLALPGTAEFTNPKTLRAGMGAWFRLPCVAVVEAELAAWLQQHRVSLWAGEMEGDPVRGRAGVGALALGVGNEGAGLGPELLALAARRVSIPLAPRAESLNVAAAAAILLWEVTRGG
jgi:TrmH family RNA methyltransferase